MKQKHKKFYRMCQTNAEIRNEMQRSSADEIDSLHLVQNLQPPEHEK